MTLTLNQQETLHAIVTGTPTGMLLKPVDSLIKRGLVIEEAVPNPAPPLPGSTFYHPTMLLRYRLTPLGFEVYEKLRTKWFEKKRKDLSDEFDRDLRWALSKVVR